MSDEKLKLVETCALLILLDEAREVPNAYLSREVGIELKPANRNRLVDLKLIEVRKEGQRIHLSLSDRGWRQALQMIGDDAPVGSGYRGATIYRLARTIRRSLERSGQAPAEFFAPADVEAEQDITGPDQASVATMIRRAYRTVAQAPGEPVRLARIRAELGDVSRTVVDDAFVALAYDADIRFDPESNQKTLTAEDHDASVNIGNQTKHLIAIGA